MWGQLDDSPFRQEGLLFLGTGIMTDFLNEVGTTEVARDSLKMEVNNPASWSAQDLRTRPVIPSGPAAFLTFTLLVPSERHPLKRWLHDHCCSVCCFLTGCSADLRRHCSQSDHVLYVAVRWLTASRIDLSTHGFWLVNVLIVTVSVACSVRPCLRSLLLQSVNSLTSDELARNMSQSTSSRDACSVASEWGDQRVTSLSTGGSRAILCLYSGVRKMATWSDLPKAGSEWAL